MNVPAVDADHAMIAAVLRDMATLLEAQGGTPRRVRACAHAGCVVAAWPESVPVLFEGERPAGVDDIPGVGPGIAAALAAILACGRRVRLERLRGEVDGEALLRTVACGGGPLAQRPHDELGVDTLGGLKAIASDGRLEQLSRVGARHAAAIRPVLTRMLDRRRVARRSVCPAFDPSARPQAAHCRDGASA